MYYHSPLYRTHTFNYESRSSNSIGATYLRIYYQFIRTERLHEIVEILAAEQLVFFSKELRHDDRSNLSGLEHVTKELGLKGR